MTKTPCDTEAAGSPRRQTRAIGFLFLGALTVVVLSIVRVQRERDVTHISPPHRTALPSIVQISLSPSHGCALDTLGYVWCWGNNIHGELGPSLPVSEGCPSLSSCTIPSLLDDKRQARQVATSLFRTCILDFSGQVSCWGISPWWGRLGIEEPYESNASLDSLPPFEQMCLGEEHGCGIDQQARVVCWGSHRLAQLGPNGNDDHQGLVPLDEPAVELACGSWHTCARSASGRLWCWGRNDTFQLSTRPAAQRPGGSESAEAGAVAEASSFDATPRLVELHSPAKQISLGARHSCALEQDGRVECWGFAESGSFTSTRLAPCGRPVIPALLGQKRTYCAATPEPLDLSSVSQLQTSAGGTCVLVETSSNPGLKNVECWGAAWTPRSVLPCSFEDGREAHCASPRSPVQRQSFALGSQELASIALTSLSLCWVSREGVLHCAQGTRDLEHHNPTPTGFTSALRSRHFTAAHRYGGQRTQEPPFIAERGLSCLKDTMLCPIPNRTLPICQPNDAYLPAEHLSLRVDTSEPTSSLMMKAKLSPLGTTCTAAMHYTCGNHCSTSPVIMVGGVPVEVVPKENPHRLTCEGDDSLQCCETEGLDQELGFRGRLDARSNQLLDAEICRISGSK